MPVTFYVALRITGDNSIAMDAAIEFSGVAIRQKVDSMASFLSRPFKKQKSKK